MAPSEHSYLTTATPGYPNTTQAQENDLKSNLIMIIDTFKEEINKSFKEIQQSTIMQVKEMKDTIQDLKMEIKQNEKTQTEANLETENVGKRCKQYQQNPREERQNLRSR